jgi:hypothetical protein
MAIDTQAPLALADATMPKRDKRKSAKARRGPRIMGVGMPASLKLQEFGSQVWAAFGEPPYLVGSALRSKKWRDVDVRLILDDQTYATMGLGDPVYTEHNGKWIALCLAFSALGKEMTGLPIDFQIQQQTYANKTFKGWRSGLGIVPLRIKE